MDDVAKLRALRNWILGEEGSKSFIKASAVKGYEQMGAYVLARLNEGRFKDVAGLHCFARNLERAIWSDIGHGADEEDGHAMLAFWANAFRFVSSLGPPEGATTTTRPYSVKAEGDAR